MRALVWCCSALPVVWAALAARPGRLAWWEAVGCLLVLAAAVLVVRRRPVVALGLTTVAWLVVFLSRAAEDSTLGAVAMSTGLVLISFLAGRHAATGHRGTAVLVVSTAAAGALGVLDTALAAFTGIALLAVLPWSVGRYRRRYAELVQAGWDHAERLERDAEQARARERARLAAEMHDLVGHELAQAALRIGALEVMADLDAEHRASARAARAGVTAAAERLADAVGLLRADHEEPVEPVERTVERARESGLRIDLAGDLPPDPVIARTVHRVVTEAVTNAIKHAPGAAVSVHIVHSDGDHPGGVAVRVVNGPGERAPDAVGSGLGLLGLAERVALVGGEFTAEPRAGGGFEVVATMPPRPVPTDTRSRRRQVEQRVQHSARRTVLLACALAVGVMLSAVGYLVFDAATSTLDDYDGLRVGQPESEIDLPARTRVDNPEDARPPGDCRYYSTHANPFDARREDLYRLCFAGGVLVDKALLVRDP